MFSGIITDIGEVVSAKRQNNQDLLLAIKTRYDTEEIQLGDSIACSGVCLTVVKKEPGIVFFEASDETLSCTNSAQWQVGSVVNLERALVLGQSLDGHIVLGHVDTVARIKKLEAEAGSHIVTIELPELYAHLVAEKGSVTLNGISLTVNQVERTYFTINVIPHTWEHTNFHTLSVGDTVNMECDMMARYVARLAECKEWMK